MKKAEEKCSELKVGVLKEDCIFDICHGGNVNTAADVEASAEVLDSVALRQLDVEEALAVVEVLDAPHAVLQVLLETVDLARVPAR